MLKTCHPVLLLFLLITATSLLGQDQGQEAKPDPLRPLLFLEGTWHGEGQGPYGPYEFETIVERRGRWLLLTSDIFVPNTDNLLFVSTQVYGYDDRGLVLQLFDTAGAFEFRGETGESQVRFGWRDGDRYKRLEMHLQDGKIHSQYDAFEPTLFKDPVRFEGAMLPGARPKKGS